jgi:tRNA-specific 2-thiouridylase
MADGRITMDGIQMKKKVALAMSGGVDSSVAAGLLKDQGYEVVGITMQIWPQENFDNDVSSFGGCCSLSAVEDARRVAAKFSIPHYVLNFRSVFQRTVIDDFIDEYRKGRTPNPCIRCNQHVKFKALLEKAFAVGCDYLATGHYARVEFDDSSKKYRLLRGVDKSKDQSYVLYVINQDQLKHMHFPLGGYKKTEIRKIAKEMGLSVAEKEESQEICFIPGKRYADFIAEKLPGSVQDGDIVNTAGEVIGRHKGLIYYTCGQRKGLRISSPRPLYVVEIDKKNNRLVVGDEKELYNNELVADELSLITLTEIKDRLDGQIQIRYNSKAQPGSVFPVKKNKVKVVFDKPQKAIAPGQAAVFYDGDVVVGGATIEKAGSF